MKISFQKSVILFSSVLWLFIAETAITDLFLTSTAKQGMMVLCVVLLTFIITINHQLLNQKHILIYILSFVIMIFSLILRYIYISDENFESLFKSFFKYYSVLVLIICAEFYLKKIVNGTRVIQFPFYVKVLFSVVIFSFLAYLTRPLIIFEFNDHAGHSIKLVYGSFSSSIYSIGNASFARLNAIFDEPGTYGMFISFLVSFVYYLERKITISLIFVILAGIVSVSLSFYLFLVLFFLMAIFPKIAFKLNVRSLLGGALLITIFAVLLNSRQELEMVNYVFERFESIASNDNNRSSGNAEAILSIVNEPVGVNVKDFDDRKFTSSGIFVIAAYHGILYSFSFIGLFLGFLLTIYKDGKAWPIVLAVGISILTRNNMFNYSGLSIILLALTICHVSTLNRKVN